MIYVTIMLIIAMFFLGYYTFNPAGRAWAMLITFGSLAWLAIVLIAVRG